MNFPLKYLENHLPEQWLLEGEELFESGAVENLTETERHLWAAQIAGFEAEVKISPSKVQAYSCDCSQFKQERGCGHISAVLLALRSKTKDRPAPIKETQAKEPRTLTVPGLLHHVRAEDLADFVRDYARHNRPFALALKARFTATLPLEDKKQKYHDLLDATISSVRSKNDQVNFRGTQQLIQVTRELLKQAEEALSRRALQEAFPLLSSVLEKIAPISRKVTGKDKRLQEELNRAFNHINQLLQLQPAPDLAQSLWNFALAESQKFVFRQSAIQVAYFRLLHQVAPGLGKTEELLAFFQLQQKQLDASDPNRLPLLLLTHQLLTAAGDTPRMQEHMLEHLHEPAFVLFVVEEALSGGHWKKARFLAEKGLENASGGARSGELEEHLLHLALREKDRDAILHFAASRFLETRQLTYLEHLKNHSGENWRDLVDTLLEKLEQMTWSIPRRDATAHLLFEAGRFDELFQYIIRLQSLDLLGAYGPQWPADRFAQAEQMYLEVVQNYLQDHLGRKPSQRVREVLERLMEAEGRELAGRLLATFRANYAGRQSLMDELEEIRL